MKILAFIGILFLVFLISVLIGTMFAILSDESELQEKDNIRERERWSRTLDE